MKTQHTPGEWINNMTGDTGMNDDGVIIVEDNPDIIICPDVYGRDKNEQMANARLIAASPMLLEALKELGDWDLHSKCADGTPAKNAEASLANVRRFARAAVVAAEGN